MLVPTRRRGAVALTLVLIGSMFGDVERPASASEIWSNARSARPGLQSRFEAVACVSNTNCLAVGSYHDRLTRKTLTLAEHWDGTTWSIDRRPNAGRASELHSVSCTSTSDCFAVGNFTNDADAINVLIEHWDGAAWRRLTSPSPQGVRSATLESVACSSTARCIAVGRAIDTSGHQVGFSERWNGTSWNIVAVPSLPNSWSTALWSASCVSSSDCVAVGSSQSATTMQFQTLVQHWDGTRWTIVESPNPTDSYSSRLHGVSCTSASVCVAVGDVETSPTGPFYSTLVEQWDGTTWTVVPSPNRPVIGDLGWSLLTSVSCASTTNCTAVGSYTHSTDRTLGVTVDDTLVEHWDGKGWDLVDAPDPGWDAALSSVSCTSSADCLAVGRFEPLAQQFSDKTLALRSA